MKNIRLILLILLLGLGLALFFGYRWWEARQLATVWALVPENAIAVVACENTLEKSDQWKEQAAWKNLQTLPFFRRVQQRLQTVLRYDEVGELLKNKRLLTSLHVVATQDFDYVFYLPLDGEKEKNAAQSVINRFRNDPQYRTDTRNFGGLLITEITHKPSGSHFSCIVHQEVMVGSFTPFLVEDVIRTIEKTSGVQKNPWMNLQQAHRKGKDDVQVYVNAAMLSDGLQALMGPALHAEGQLLNVLAQSARFAAEATSAGITLQGDFQAAAGENEMPFLATLARQSPQPFSSLYLIPKRTAAVQHWTLSDAKQWQTDLLNYQQLDAEMAGNWAGLRQQGINPEGWFDWMGNELTLITLEPVQSQTDKLLLVQAKDVDQALRYLGKASQKMKKSSSESQFTEKFGGTTIQRLDADFPARVLSSRFTGFSECFYITYENYIVLASGIPALKQWFDDVRKEEVWSRSARQKQIIQHLQPKANYTFLVNTTRLWPLLLQNATLSWRSLIQGHETVFKRYEWLSGQISNNGGALFPAQLQLHYSEGRTPPGQRNKYILNVRTRLDTTVRSEPFVVRSHVNNSIEVLTQDVAKRIYLIDQKGKILWRKWLERPIVGDVHQIDYLSNGKLQYLFATERKLYLLDRNGQPVGNFPVNVPTVVPLQGVSVIDYDGNQDYRFAVADLIGDVFLFNKEGTLLEGWNPLRLGYRLQGPVQHLRIQDKDYLIALQMNGKVQVLNRRGQPYPGFPVDLGELTSSTLFVEPQMKGRQTVLTALTNHGAIIKLDLTGKIREKKQLYRSSRETLFTLCPDVQGTGWLVLRQDQGKVALLDKQGETLFEQEGEPGHTFRARYYNFGAGLQVVALTDMQSKETFLYDLAGRKIGNTPVSTGLPVSILYVEDFDKLLTYYTDKQQLEVSAVKVK